MFISKKKFEETIENAKKEECERMWERNRFERLEECLNRRMGELERKLWDLERRLQNLEGTNKAPSDNSHCGDTVAPGTGAIGYV